ncbi:MAG TPA: S8 family peptidase [Acidimicrobiales bacterium]|nr:S8 family peptidase [Acidimicrobiales bacterium]
MRRIFGRAGSSLNSTASGGGHRPRAWVSLALSASLLSASVAMAPPSSAALLGLLGSETVIVTAGSSAGAAALVVAELGTVLTTLPVVNSVQATVSPAVAAALALLPGVTVTPDISVDVQSVPPQGRPGAAVFPEATGATVLAGQGDTGSGVNVAVLDTGIDNLPDFAGRLAGGVDLTGGGNPFRDDYGHGTFVAGLIAGDGASSAGTYTGEAPGAGLVSVKVAGASGTTSLSTLISGIGWTIANRVPLGIRALNLSLGSVPTTSTLLNPLDRAVEAAWNAGIVVVASAGNAGPFNGTIMAPGDDPLVITVGSLDDNGTPTSADDVMSPFSSVGPTSPDGWLKPDLVASGRSVVSLRAPGSTIDNAYPSARVGAADFVGSGTSFSTAITTGAVALVLSMHPTLTPDQVKARILATTTPGPVGNPFVDGHGAVDALAAASAPALDLAQNPLGGVAAVLGETVGLSQRWAVSSWNPLNWSGLVGLPGAAATGTAWNGTAWNGTAWNSSQWGS